jgi:hypothetical protein
MWVVFSRAIDEAWDDERILSKNLFPGPDGVTNIPALVE